MAAWAQVAALGEPCVVLEDDAVLSSDLPAFFDAVQGLAGVEHISLETRSRKKLLGRKVHARAPIRRLYQDRTGPAAYVVWPCGAAKLMAHARRAGAPSDALISSTYGLASWQADPALAVQLDQCAAYGVPQTIPTVSLIDAVGKPPLEAETAAQRRAYRARRIAAQLRMGWRQLRYAGLAKRVHVAPTTQWVQVTSRRD